MPMTDDEPKTHSLPPRIALLSIAGFWAFYFTVVTVRGFALDYADQGAVLLRRIVVVLASAGITWIFYLIVRRIPTAHLRRSIAVCALLTVPAAILYSAGSYYIFEKWPPHSHDKQGGKTATSARPMTPATMGNMLPAPPAPPAPPAAGGKMAMDDDMTPFQAIADNSANGYFLFAAWAALYLALCYAVEVGALERRAAALRAAAQSAELRALRYQVNPHFLFNTLNSLSSLVLSGRSDQAERMIINLSTFFRTSLAGDPTEDVPLSEEIALQRLYLGIEAVRFPERLIVEIDVPPALTGACVPGLILQPLVENAVKYGVSRTQRPVTIRIRATREGDRLALTVEDDGDPSSPVPAGGTGVGLANVRDRLTARYGEDGDCRWGPRPAGGFAVLLLMPMVGDAC